MALDREGDLSPRDIVLDGDPAPLKRDTATALIGPYVLWAKGWMAQDAIWYGGRPRPRQHCIRRGPSSARKGQSSPPSFRPMSIVAMVDHLSY